MDSGTAWFALTSVNIPPRGLAAHDRRIETLTGRSRELRSGMAYTAIVFPLLLWWGGAWAGSDLKGSMSDYYHSGMRNWFVGLLLAVGSFLYLYKGFSPRENIALNLAGLCALGVALFPSGESSLHAPSALLLFACMVYVAIATHGDTVK